MRRTRTAPDFHSMTLLLHHEEMQTLDALSRLLRVPREDVLKRGLFLMDVAHTIQDAPGDADIQVSVHCPHDGAQMVRLP